MSFISLTLAVVATICALLHLYARQKGKKVLVTDVNTKTTLITNPTVVRLLGQTALMCGVASVLIKSLSISVFAAFVSAAIGFVVAALTWKLYPQFVSRSERYRTSNAKYFFYRSFTALMLGFLISSFSMNHVFQSFGANNASNSISAIQTIHIDKSIKSSNPTTEVLPLPTAPDSVAEKPVVNEQPMKERANDTTAIQQSSILLGTTPTNDVTTSRSKDESVNPDTNTNGTLLESRSGRPIQSMSTGNKSDSPPPPQAALQAEVERLKQVIAKAEAEKLERERVEAEERRRQLTVNERTGQIKPELPNQTSRATQAEDVPYTCKNKMPHSIKVYYDQPRSPESYDLPSGDSVRVTMRKSQQGLTWVGGVTADREYWLREDRCTR
jgi:hypothetical protein